MSKETIKCLRCGKIVRREQLSEKPRTKGLCPKCKRWIDRVSGIKDNGFGYHTDGELGRTKREIERRRWEMGDFSDD